MNNHAMLDLETASSAKDAAILTVGLLLFDPYGDGSEDNEYHWVIPFGDNKHGRVDLQTVRWWMEQSDEARKAAWLGTRGPVAGEAPFWNITCMLDKAEHIWANDPDFDCVIMQDFFEKNNAKWRYFRKHRSVRTLKALFDIPFIEPVGTQHNALDDCKYQAKIVRAVYQNNAPPIYLFGNPPAFKEGQ